MLPSNGIRCYLLSSKVTLASLVLAQIALKPSKNITKIKHYRVNWKALDGINLDFTDFFVLLNPFESNKCVFILTQPQSKK